jgi:Flp pilus assembly protein TadG
VTAETALALPALVVVLTAVLGTGQVLLAQVRCVDAARAAARAAARGDSSDAVTDLARRLAPGGSTVTLTDGVETVEVRVRAGVRVAVAVPPVAVGASAVAAREVP